MPGPIGDKSVGITPSLVFKKPLIDKDKADTMLTLKEYRDEAEKIIMKLGGNLKWKMIKDEDAISFIAESMMISDWKYDRSKNVPIDIYRNKSKFYAMGKYRRQLFGKKYFNLENYDMTQIQVSDINQKIKDGEEQSNDAEYIDRLIKRAELTPKENHILRSVYYDDVSINDLSREYGCSRKVIINTLHNAISRLREVV